MNYSTKTIMLDGTAWRVPRVVAERIAELTAEKEAWKAEESITDDLAKERIESLEAALYRIRDYDEATPGPSMQTMARAALKEGE